MSDPSTQYSSRLGAILTMIGVAVGLGNVWRFPYMMGSYGGSAFLVAYFVFTMLFAFPALIAEISLGKSNPKGTIAAFESIFKAPTGRLLGYLFVGVVSIAGSYYAVVVANVLYTALFSITKGFSANTNPDYQQSLGDGTIQYLFTVLVIILALLVSSQGLKKGIERISMFIMPFFVVSILYMIGYAWSLPETIAAVAKFMKPDLDAFGSTEVFAALGQAFFSVGLGGTFVVVYSGYLSEDREIPRVAVFTCLGDLGSSVLVSLFLVPVILVFGLQMDAGPSLIFNTLPELFTVLPAGRWIGSLFLVALFMVAFLSLIAAFQVPLSSLNIKGFSGKRLILAFGLIQLVLAFPSAYYPQIIGILDLVFGSGMQVLGSMLVVVGIWWGARTGEYRRLLFADPESKRAHVAQLWFRWAIPGTLLLVLLGYLYENFL